MSDVLYIPSEGNLEITTPNGWSWKHHVYPGETLILVDTEDELPELEEGLEQYLDWLETDARGKTIHPGHKQTVIRLLEELGEGHRR